MTNLVQVAEEITYVPTDQLAGMIDNPNSRFPSFIVLSEIQRRNLDKRAYDAEVAAQNKPDTTVAQEAVAELTGLAGVPSNQPLSSPMGESPVGGGVPAPSGLGGMQMMAGGGRTGYSSGTRTQSAIDRLNRYLQLDPSRLPEGGRSADLLALQAQMQNIDPNQYRSLYNEIMSRPASDYIPAGPHGYMVDYKSIQEKEAREAQENAIERARMKMLTDAGLGGQVLERLSELGPDSVPTYIPIGKEDEIKSAGDYLSSQLMTAGTDLSGNLILNGESREEVGPPIERLRGESETQSQSDFETARKQAESLYSGLNIPNLEAIKTDTSGLRGLLQNIPEFDRSKYEIDFDAPTPEERAKDRQTKMLGGLAEIVGGAKNLGEMGAGVGRLSQDIQDMRKEARKEDLDLAKQRVSSEIAIDALAKGDREERVLLNKTILQLEQADNVAEQNRILKMYEYQSSKAGQVLQSTVDLLKNKTQESNIRRLTEQGRLELYKEENDKLQEIATQLSNAMGAQRDLLMNQYKEQKAYVDQIAGVVRQDQYPNVDFSSIQTSNKENDPLGIRR